MMINFTIYFLLCVFTLTSATIYDPFFYWQLIFGNRNCNFETEEKVAENVNFYFYNRINENNTLYWSHNVRNAESIFRDIDKRRPFVLYIHGFLESPTAQSVLTVLDAYLTRNTDNIVILDWSNLACDGYVHVVPRLTMIATSVAKTLNHLVYRGLDPKTIHLVGHSLGAQIAGDIGRKVNPRIFRITGLDPAKYMFYPPYCYLTTCYPHIDKGDAEFVDILHTDIGLLSLGFRQPTGDAEFLANGGLRPQPGCPVFGNPPLMKGLCSHQRSWDYYAESVKNEHAFPAYHADSYWHYRHGGAYGVPVYYGYAMDTNARGIYYFRTRASSPFSLETN